MANVIQIKRGKESDTHAPADNALKEYELGFGTDYKRLFIGLKEGQEEKAPVKAVPIAMDLREGLPIEFGGTSATTERQACDNIAQNGGTIYGDWTLGTREKTVVTKDENGEKKEETITEYGKLILNETYSYGKEDPNKKKPIVDPPKGHLYFKLIEE